MDTAVKMSKRGAGYPHEILIGVFFLLLIVAFYGKGSVAIMPPVLMIIGAVLILGGAVSREPMLIAGGFVAFAIALMYAEVFIK